MSVGIVILHRVHATRGEDEKDCSGGSDGNDDGGECVGRGMLSLSATATSIEACVESVASTGEGGLEFVLLRRWVCAAN